MTGGFDWVDARDVAWAAIEAAEKGGVRIGIGCTGGRHRSVAVTEAVARQLKPLVDELHISHRDITKDK